MDDVKIEGANTSFGNWAFILFLILILLIFGFGLFFI